MRTPAKGLGKLQRTALWLLNRKGSTTPKDVVMWSLYGDMTTVYEDESERPSPDWRYRGTRSQLVAARRALAGLHRRGIVERYTFDGCGAQQHVAYCRVGYKHGQPNRRRPAAATVEMLLIDRLKSVGIGNPYDYRQLVEDVHQRLGYRFPSSRCVTDKINRILWRHARSGNVWLEWRTHVSGRTGRYLKTIRTAKLQREIVASQGRHPCEATTRPRHDGSPGIGSMDCCFATENGCEATNAGAA